MAALRRTGQVGRAVTRAVESEVADFFDRSPGAGESVSTAASVSAKETALPIGLRLARRCFQNMDLQSAEKSALLDALQDLREKPRPFKSSKEFRQFLADHGGPGQGATEQLARQHPNFFPSLLTQLRAHPPLALKGKLQFDFSSVPAASIRFVSRPGGRVEAEVTTSVNQLLGDSRRAGQLAEDYASDDVGLKFRIPVGEGKASDFQALPLEARRQLLKQGLQSAPQLTTMVHGFQSTKEIWDSTAHTWMEEGGVGLAIDGFGASGQARSDGSAPYTPKQYAFQVLESLDALGLLGGKDLKVVGHSMGGAATGEMAVALDKAGYSKKAEFVLLAPACSPDHMPIFQAHRNLVDLANAVLIGGIYVPLGAWDLTAPLVQWTDEKFPLMTKLMVDYGLGLKDSPKAVRDLNADYYRSADPQSNRQRRARSLEAMMGMATQDGIQPEELRHASQRFGVFVANFGLDRLVDPEAVRRLQGEGIGYAEIPSGSHNAAFAAQPASRLARRSREHFEKI